MLIFTSNYSKISRRDTSDLLLIRISSSRPDWFTKEHVTLPELYPDWDLVTGYKEGRYTEEQYTEKYSQKLTDELKESVRNKIQQLLNDSGKGKAVLLCWCGGFCHRHIVNNWLDGNGELY